MTTTAPTTATTTASDTTLVALRWPAEYLGSKNPTGGVIVVARDHLCRKMMIVNELDNTDISPEEFDEEVLAADDEAEEYKVTHASKERSEMYSVKCELLMMNVNVPLCTLFFRPLTPISAVKTTLSAMFLDYFDLRFMAPSINDIRGRVARALERRMDYAPEARRGPFKVAGVTRSDVLVLKPVPEPTSQVTAPVRLPPAAKDGEKYVEAFPKIPGTTGSAWTSPLKHLTPQSEEVVPTTTPSSPQPSTVKETEAAPSPDTPVPSTATPDKVTEASSTTPQPSKEKKGRVVTKATPTQPASSLFSSSPSEEATPRDHPVELLTIPGPSTPTTVRPIPTVAPAPMPNTVLYAGNPWGYAPYPYGSYVYPHAPFEWGMYPHDVPAARPSQDFGAPASSPHHHAHIHPHAPTHGSNHPVRRMPQPLYQPPVTREQAAYYAQQPHPHPHSTDPWRSDGDRIARLEREIATLRGSSDGK